MSKKTNKMTQPKQAKQNKKPFRIDILVGIIAALFVVFTIIYVIWSHLDIDFNIPTGEVVEMTYPASILQGAAEETAETMKDSDGVYKATVNSDGSLTVQLSVERYEKIKEAALNAVNSMTIVSIGDDTAIRNYVAEEDHTILNITVNPQNEKLASEVSDSVYTARLYHVCHMNTTAQITVNYIDDSTNEMYLTEVYDLDGNLVSSAELATEEPTV